MNVFATMPPNTGQPDWVQPAIARGHDLCPDPVGSSISEIRAALQRDSAALAHCSRFTCRQCGATALRSYDSAYGSAFNETPCDGDE